MNRISASLAVVALGTALFACSAASQGTAQGGAKLEAQDYIDIRQLIEGYSAILDNCTNNGNTYADTGYQNTWEVTRAQGGNKGILVDYTGGKIGASFGSGTPESRAKQFLGQVEPVLPGATKAWNGRATVDFWPGYRWTKGSYSYWKVGQYTAFAGMERARQGNCHFAGEHTSIDFQGYLNGAVESGQRVASEILADLK